MTNWGDFQTERGTPTKRAKGTEGYVQECMDSLAPEFRILDWALAQIKRENPHAFPIPWGERIVASVKYRLIYAEGGLDPETHSSVGKYLAEVEARG